MRSWYSCIHSSEDLHIIFTCLQVPASWSGVHFRSLCGEPGKSHVRICMFLHQHIRACNVVQCTSSSLLFSLYLASATVYPFSPSVFNPVSPPSYFLLLSHLLPPISPQLLLYLSYFCLWDFSIFHLFHSSSPCIFPIWSECLKREKKIFWCLPGLSEVVTFLLLSLHFHAFCPVFHPPPPPLYPGNLYTFDQNRLSPCHCSVVEQVTSLASMAFPCQHGQHGFPPQLGRWGSLERKVFTCFHWCKRNGCSLFVGKVFLLDVK